MKRWSHREYLTRLAWLDEQWNNPSLSDYYMMQISLDIISKDNKKARNLKLEQLKLKFDKVVKKTAKTREQAAKESKAKWFGWLGVKQDG